MLRAPPSICPTSVIDALELPDGQRQVVVESTAPPGCPACGVISVRVHSGRRQRVRDVPTGGPLRVVWASGAASASRHSARGGRSASPQSRSRLGPGPWSAARGASGCRLELGHRLNNPASCRVATAAGFLREGIERAKLRYGEERFDVETPAGLRIDPAPAIAALPMRF